MKIRGLFIVVFLVVILFSCSNNENEMVTQEKAVNLSEDKSVFREPGQIPKEVNFYSKLLSARDNEFKLIALLQDFKAEYGSTDFYNNLFELTSFEIFENENFKNIGADELKFLLDEMRSVKSNMLNIGNIPIILIACKDAEVINRKEITYISDEFYSKNKKQIEMTKWSDLELRDKKQAELSEMVTVIFRYNRYGVNPI